MAEERERLRDRSMRSRTVLGLFLVMEMMEDEADEEREHEREQQMEQAVVKVRARRTLWEHEFLSRRNIEGVWWTLQEFMENRDDERQCWLFTNFTRIDPDMFDEMVLRLAPVIESKRVNARYNYFLFYFTFKRSDCRTKACGFNPTICTKTLGKSFTHISIVVHFKIESCVFNNMYEHLCVQQYVRTPLGKVFTHYSNFIFQADYPSWSDVSPCPSSSCKW